MVEIPPKRARRVTLLQCLLIMFIAGVLGAPVSEAATVVLAWDPSPDPQIIGYNVYRSESLGTFAVSALNGSLVSDTTFTDSTLEWNRTYYYVVTAVNADGVESAPSASVEAASWLPAFVAEDYSSSVSTAAQQEQQQAVEAAPSAPPPSDSVSAPVITQPTPFSATVTTSVSEDGQRWFEVNGVWYPWGYGSDVPVPGDFDGDGQTDISIYRPGDGTWWILTSSSGFSNYSVYQWGLDGDTPVPADYDYDGRTDIAVFRSSTGVSYVLTSSSDFYSSIYF
jgi:hypothetical protein